MKALIIGATGLVGKQLVELLLADERFTEIVVFTRNRTGYSDPKLVEHFVDFADPSSWRELLQGDVFFSALGTTLKAAGSKMAQYEVDYSYQLNFATAAAGNGVAKYVLVSSVGADPSSWYFYLRMKGELEQKVEKLPFGGISILRPTQLYGERAEKRKSEEIGLSMMRFLNKIGVMKGRRPVHGRTVAAAMIEAALDNKGINIVEGKEIRFLASQYNDHTLGAGK